MNGPVVDVWMQHPTPRFLEQPFFASLLRWTRREAIPEVPPATTIAAIEALGLSPATERLFLCDNARRVFRLDDLLPPVA